MGNEEDSAMSKKGAYKSEPFQTMVSYLQEQFAKLPDCRTGKNQFISMRDIGLSAFSVFFNQCPSFLEHQRLMERRSGKNNAKSLFGIEHIPSDNHIRQCLDPIAPSTIYPVFHYGLKQVQEAGLLDEFRCLGGQLLIAVDGLHYFTSKDIHCELCSRKQHKDGSIRYAHSLVSATIVQPGRREVLPLPPEFIEPQDGHDKEDGERAAIKRWLMLWGKTYCKLGVTLLGDDLYACQPVCEAILGQEMHFIMTCKEGSHRSLYEWVNPLKATGALPMVEQTVNVKGKRYQYRCHYMNDVPIREGKDALLVHWLSVSVFDGQGKQVYKGAFITDHRLNEQNIVEVAQAGRTRWKTENEHNNTLKNHGYYLEHNYGHGKAHLSSLLATLILLSFMFHTLLVLLDKRYQELRAHWPRKSFFQQLRTLMFYLYFVSWDALMNCMLQPLEPDTS